MVKLDLVIVTFNRLEKLKQTLSHYVDQTKGFRNLIIVNNCSTDDTGNFLTEWYKKFKDFTKFHPIIINASENLGGSGGFYLGQKKAMELKADWVFVADDDAYAYAASDMVERFYDFIDTHKTDRLAAVCAKVLNLDGSICCYHRSTHSIINGEHVRFNSKEEDYQNEFFHIDDLSYVGSFINCKAMEKVGMVNPNYFIYSDDSEHSMRLKKYGGIVVVPSISIKHEGGDVTPPPGVLVSWRNYYLVRNTTHMLLKHCPRAGIKIIWKNIKYEINVHLGRTKRPSWQKVYRRAVLDAFFGRLGKHSVYKPGWCMKS